MSHGEIRRVTLALTGASGAPYGLRLLQCLLAAGRQVHLLVSRPGLLVISGETDLRLSARPAQAAKTLAERYGAGPGQLRVHGQDEWTAPIASGSGVADAMVICPCSTSTLSSIAVGASNNLLERAADVTLKEQRPLIVVPRETPLSVIHLENMLRLARMGVLVLPANPGFYHRPARVEDLVDFVVARILDRLGVIQDLVPPWGEGRDQGGP